jgi:lysozyme
MKTNDAGRGLIIQDEKMELEAYPDPGSPLAEACEQKGIDLSRYRRGPGWEQMDGDPMDDRVRTHRQGSRSWPAVVGGEVLASQLERDIEQRGERPVNELVEYCLNENQFSALVSLVFNIGEEAFRGSTLRRKLNVGDVAGAADEFERWRFSRGKPLAGLERRRREERELFLTPLAAAA